MNFLQLCQRTAEKSGTIAGLPSFTSVTGAQGRLSKLVGWVSDAWRDIQNERSDWLFLRQEFSHALTINQTRYTEGDLGLSAIGVSAWSRDTPQIRSMTLYDPDTGQSDEGDLEFVTYESWRRHYDRGSHDANRPSYWTASPARELCVGPKPDKAYVLRGSYRRKAQILAADGDIPICPDQFHGLIVIEALRIMARDDEAFNVIVEKNLDYDRLRAPLVNDQTPPVDDLWGSPLA